MKIENLEVYGIKVKIEGGELNFISKISNTEILVRYEGEELELCSLFDHNIRIFVPSSVPTSLCVKLFSDPNFDFPITYY